MTGAPHAFLSALEPVSVYALTRGVLLGRDAIYFAGEDFQYTDSVAIPDLYSSRLIPLRKLVQDLEIGRDSLLLDTVPLKTEIPASSPSFVLFSDQLLLEMAIVGEHNVNVSPSGLNSISGGDTLTVFAVPDPSASGKHHRLGFTISEQNFDGRHLSFLASEGEVRVDLVDMRFGGIAVIEPVLDQSSRTNEFWQGNGGSSLAFRKVEVYPEEGARVELTIGARATIQLPPIIPPIEIQADRTRGLIANVTPDTLQVRGPARSIIVAGDELIPARWERIPLEIVLLVLSGLGILVASLLRVLFSDTIHPGQNSIKPSE